MSSNKNAFPMSLLAVLLSAALLIQASLELNRVAWGTGIWLGE